MEPGPDTLAGPEKQTELEREAQTPPSPPARCASDSEPLTLETLMVKYLRLTERTLAPKTLAYRKTVFRRFLTHMGNMPVASISTDQVEDYLLSRPSNHNFNKDRAEPMRLFSWGFQRRLIPVNPVSLVEKLSVERAKKVIPTLQEMSKILLAAGEDRPLPWCSFTPWRG
jgi:hypothetical protein